MYLDQYITGVNTDPTMNLGLQSLRLHLFNKTHGSGGLRALITVDPTKREIHFCLFTLGLLIIGKQRGACS